MRASNLASECAAVKTPAPELGECNCAVGLGLGSSGDRPGADTGESD